MRSILIKLFALIAYMAMPFTMSIAMSAPMPAPSHHEETMGMGGMEGMQHCPEQSAPGVDHTAFIGCTMMCAALPGADLRGPELPCLTDALPTPAPVRAYSGIHLEIATPPPRLA